MDDRRDNNMSRYIARLENLLTAEQIREASNGAAAPLLNARDEYNRAEAWKDVYEKMLDCESAHPDKHREMRIALAKALKKRTHWKENNTI